MDEEEYSWQEILLPEGTRMDLPTGLLQSRSVLDLFFHPDTWAPHVSEDLKRRLWELLPKGISDEERSDGVDALFRGEAIRFGRNRLEDLKADLLSGGMDPVRAGMRRMLRRAEEEQSGERHAERAYQDAKDLVAKRKQVLEEVGAPSASKVDIPPPKKIRILIVIVLFLLYVGPPVCAWHDPKVRPRRLRH